MNGEKGACLVIGASAGMGAECAIELARTGHRVAIVARRADALEDVRRRCNEAAGAEVAFAYPHDVTNYDEVPALLERIVTDLGGLDTVIYAAGVLPQIERDEFDFAKDRAILEVNLIGAVAWLDPIAAKFQRQRFGTICGISSIAGDRGRRPYPAYHTAKAALDTFLEALRNRLSQHNVAVVTIKPGYVDTDMTKGMDGLFWVISPEKAAKTIVGHVKKRRRLRYVPARWGAVGFVIRNIPSFIFKKMDL